LEIVDALHPQRRFEGGSRLGSRHVNAPQHGQRDDAQRRNDQKESARNVGGLSALLKADYFRNRDGLAAMGARTGFAGKSVVDVGGHAAVGTRKVDWHG